MNSFSFVTALHGNEQLPVFALAALGKKQYLANPQAVLHNVRFVEKDMNASFGTSGNSVEEIAARKLLNQLPTETLVVDFHSFSCESPPFAIVVDLNVLPFARTTGLEHVVYMKHNVKSGHALINYRKGISVESGMHKERSTFEVTQQVVVSIESEKSAAKCNIYEVYGRIDEPGDYKNFQLFQKGTESFFPVLAGEKAYDFYGLKAKKIA